MPPISQSRRSRRNRNPFEATMIKANGSVHMRDPTLIMPIQANLDADGRYALDLLRSNCSLPAVLDSNERYDPPRCAEATRRDITQKMEDWVRDDSLHSAPPSSIFWLYGGAGAGKSALAQTLAEKFKTNDDLAASFFFFRPDVKRNDGDRLIPTLVLQLAQSFHRLTPFVEGKILQNPDLFKKSRQTQMLELLVEPLIRLSLEETDGVQSNALKLHPRLVVIDGLDECLDSNIQCDLLRIIATAIPHFPYPLRFLITSRPESHITRAFHHDVGEVARYDLSDDADADADIQKFLEGEFAKIRRTHPLRRDLPSQWPPQADISSIVDRSSGHFIYASTVIRFIQSPKHRPDDRLQVILGVKQRYEKDRPYARLDSLYRFIFLEIQDAGQLVRIHRALGIMHLRSLTSGLFGWKGWSSDRHIIEKLLELRPGDLVLLFDPLLSLVAFEKEDIRIFHKSLFDYLLDSSRSGDLQLDLGLAHENAANYLLSERRMRDGWYSADFQDFAYHCQFARLNDILTGHLRSLACDPKLTFVRSLSAVLERPEQFCLLQSILYFLQAIGRQDFDPSGHCYREFVEKKAQYLRSVVPWSRRSRHMIFVLPSLGAFRKSLSIKRYLRSSFGIHDGTPQAFGSQLNCLSGSGRTIPAVNTNVVESIEQEHEMFSSYVKAQKGYPGIAFSFLESNTDFVHSCHFVIRTSDVKVTFVMLVTYTRRGGRLSCTIFHDMAFPYRTGSYLQFVKKHFQRTQNEVVNNHTDVYLHKA